MSTSSITASGSLAKAKRENIKKIDAVSIKPPVVIPDDSGGDNHQYQCAYVSSGYQLVKQACTFDVWKRCEGKHLPGRVRDGLDSRLHNEFVLIVDPKTDVITDIDIIPKVYYTSRATLPDFLEGKDDIVLRINGTRGSSEVIQCPAGVSKKAIRRLLDNLDKIEVIQTGDSIPGGFEVLNVSGNQVSIALGHERS